MTSSTTQHSTSQHSTSPQKSARHSTSGHGSSGHSTAALGSQHAGPPGPAPSAAGSMLRQPRVVWAIAFACVISFMGIGLVDPILTSIAAELDASSSQVMLLFTSYLFITGLAMLFTSWVSSRIGAKKTLLAGLALIVVFAALAGASGSIGQIIGFRAGWGLGNALFISTALATIVASASGSTASAIILYEAALGIGIAVGPLVGGALGEVSWRAPFFGTAALMAVGFLAIVVFFGRSAPSTGPKISATASFSALKKPGLRTLALAALFYNFGFFVLLAYSPFPIEAAAETVGIHVGAHELGLVFFGWGICLAITSVVAAPRLTRRFGLHAVLYAMLGLLALDFVVLATFTDRFAVIVTAIIVAGLFLGVLNTALTEAVMESTDLPRSVASSTYSGVRFMGGAVAPAVAGPIRDHLGLPAPYWTAAVAVLVAIGVLVLGRRTFAQDHDVPSESAEDEALAISAGDA